MNERTKLALMVGVFILAWFLPVESVRFGSAIHESFNLIKWYAREHVLLCLVPAFFIAGAIGVFLSQNSVLKLLGPTASKFVSYPVAAASGTVLAVCSCTVLPIFAGLHRRGAGLGPATAFLYSGPAINVMAIILTARVLGFELGIARALGAIGFAIILGILMHLTFRKEEAEKNSAQDSLAMPEIDEGRSPAKTLIMFAAMIGILVFANWGRPENAGGIWNAVYSSKWIITAGFGAILAFAVIKWTQRDELEQWTESSWDFAKQIMPLLLAGVAAAGFLLGGPGSADAGIIPSDWIEKAVGGNSIWANFFASILGALMYFATLTEVPILEGLLKAGMGKGPALALLLSGPAVSLPNLLVIRSVLGTRKTAVFVGLVVVLSTTAGIIYGALF